MPIEERNDALKRDAKIPLARYEFADDKLPGNIMVGDFGCGTGYGTKILKNKHREVIGLDKPGVVKQANIDYPGEYLDVDFNDPIIIIYEFEAIVCLETLLHLKEPIEFLSKLKCDYLVISAPVDTDPNDGYIYRLHNINEHQFKEMIVKKWILVDEMHQRASPTEHYITLYAKSSNNR